MNNVGSNGYYWSSSLNADYGDSNAYNLNFNNGNVNWQNNNNRYNGFPVRGVLAEHSSISFYAVGIPYSIFVFMIYYEYLYFYSYKEWTSISWWMD